MPTQNNIDCSASCHCRWRVRLTSAFPGFEHGSGLIQFGQRLVRRPFALHTGRRKAAESSHLGQNSVSLAHCEKLQWRILISSYQRLQCKCSVPNGLQSCVRRGILGAHCRTVGFSSAELVESQDHRSRNAMVDQYREASLYLIHRSVQ